MKKSLRQDGPGRQDRFDPAIIESLGIEILTFIAEDKDRLGRFFDLTGLNVQTLRKAAGTYTFNTSLFDYLGSDEGLLCAFADQKGYDPAAVDAIRQNLDCSNRNP